MIFVTGTKRSGTSMWMQILEAGGFPWIGAPYMGDWERSIKPANPKGFYESKLRQGVFFATNPDPKTGAFLRPEQTRRHVVKVFIPGLIRSDLAYIDRVICTMRPWREYAASMARLHALEDAYHASLDDEARARAEREVSRTRPRVPPEVEWWFDTYELIRDVATRRYPFHLTTYHRMLREPEPEIRQVFEWLGGGDVDRANEIIDRELNTQRISPTDPVSSALAPDLAALCDEIHDRADAQRGLTPELVERMNAWQETMVERWGEPSRDRAREDVDLTAAPPGDDADGDATG
jgi:hypothetical protein